MKSILYAGAVLMAGACIYGFTDYRKTSTKNEFREMYTEEKQVVPASGELPKETIEASLAEVSKPQTVARKKSIRPAEESGTDITLTAPERMDGTEMAEIGNSEVTVEPPKKISFKKKKKRLDSKMFSRAPIREVHEEVILVPEEKTAAKETRPSKEL
jgi:hypothetical protein